MDVEAIKALLTEAAARHGIAPELLRALAWVESRFNPSATSSAGAMGVMQLMPATARGLGVENPFDPAENIEGGAKFFARLLERFGNERDALAAYNWGPARVADGKPWPASVQGYVRKVLARRDSELGTEPSDEPSAAPREVAQARPTQEPLSSFSAELERSSRYEHLLAELGGVFAELVSLQERVEALALECRAIKDELAGTRAGLEELRS